MMQLLTIQVAAEDSVSLGQTTLINFSKVLEITRNFRFYDSTIYNSEKLFMIWSRFPNEQITLYI